MSLEDIVNAWSDEDYRASLSAEQRAALPASPVGEIELTEEELAEVDGGTTWACATVTLVTAVLCPSIVAGGTCEVDTSGCCGPRPL